MERLSLVTRNPTVDEYCSLRACCGLSAKSIEAASRGLSGTLHSVVFENGDGHAVGMGRVIGDGDCFYQVVDIAVHPNLQKQGCGNRIMQALVSWIHTNAPATAVVTLLADGTAYKLYEKFGFALSEIRA